MERILVVDDEMELTSIIEELLREENYGVDCVNDGSSALLKSRKNEYDLILLDIMMPGIDGLEVCRLIRKQTNCPILFLTAKTDVNDHIKGLNEGGDDYITKPFSQAQLLARINAHLRREKRHNAPLRQKKYRELILIKEKNELFFKQQKVNLTKREFNIMDVLLSRPGQIFSKDHLYDAAWGRDALGYSSTIAEHIRNIRAKLQEIDPNTEIIHTVWGVGYKVE
ncbi:response regulator transcription factor [Alteribacillus sp. HJP-4]|uniref:response regulator transcription factor n=1 Tax=Alteribacillus sp. HJP-4 TaxID=2775394 RepID=UPI0035CCDBDD